MTPEVGHLLHSSCSGLDVYEVIGVGRDENGAPTIDVKVLDLNEILHFEHDDEAKEGEWFAPLTRGELPPGVSLVLRGLQWKPGTYPDQIRVNAPIGGCYRCTELFTLHDAPRQ